jgi:ribosomal protein S18 acetylase RimI-like enzyme
MGETMNVRPAEEKDIEGVVELAFQFENYLDELESTPESERVPRHRIKQVFLEGFSDPKHVILVVEEDDKIIGYSDFWIYPEFIHGGQTAYLNNIFISEKFRRKGIGSKLLGDTIKKAKGMDAVALHISILPKNIIAQNFYKKNDITWEIKMLELKLK